MTKISQVFWCLIGTPKLLMLYELKGSGGRTLSAHTYLRHKHQWGEKSRELFKSLWGFREKSYNSSDHCVIVQLFSRAIYQERSQFKKKKRGRKMSINAFLVRDRGIGRNSYYYSDVFGSRELNHFNLLACKERRKHQKSFVWFLQPKRELAFEIGCQAYWKVLKS